MNGVYLTSASREQAEARMPPGTVAMAGPNLVDDPGGEVRVRSCPPGDFDIGQSTGLWDGLEPELLWVEVDGDVGCSPRQLARFPAWRILLVDGGHLNPGALSRIIGYAQSEPFHRIVLASREMAQHFAAAGLQNIGWLPGLFRQRAPLALARASGLECLGPEAPMAYRAQCLERELRCRLPAVGVGEHRPVVVVLDDGPELSTALVNAFLSGRVVLTVRPSAASGWASWIENGRECRFYDSVDEIPALLEGLRRRPEEAARLAHAGARFGESLFGSGARGVQLVDLLTYGDRTGAFALPRLSAAPDTAGKLNPARFSGFELFQQLHRTYDEFSVQIRGAVPAWVRADLAAFPRLRMVSELAAARPPAVVVAGPEVDVAAWSAEAGAEHVDYVWSLGGDSVERLGQTGLRSMPLGRGVTLVEHPPRLTGPRARRTNRRALVTIAVGEKCLREFRAHAWASWQVYAQRHGLELVVFERPLDEGWRARERSASWQKCLILEQPELRKFEQVAWVDADIVMRAASPCIFDCVPVDRVGAVDNDGYPSRLAAPRIRGELNRQIGALLGSQNGLPANARQDFARRGFSVSPNAEPFLLQAGVWVASPENHHKVFREVYDQYDNLDRSYEMVPLGYELWRRDLIHPIDWRFNAVVLDALAALCPSLLPAVLRGAYAKGFDVGCDRQTSNEGQWGINHVFANVYWMHFAGGFAEFAGLLREPLKAEAAVSTR